ncbi:hypothetical protein [Paraburkholderia sp. BCC1885]|uniref:hypothetical protein n=1 Tax=Paraburkholderia sp. BCC1885 TaxID=2562669 RepID=UPI001182F529|nr:hypothetical protein [Paraburkholderia sp. BCC1885]
MCKHHVAVTAVLVALTTIMLCACGADDGTSASGAQSNAANNAASSYAANTAIANAATPAGQQTSATPVPPPAYGASAALTKDPNAAPDPAVQNVEASLAADSQQVAPVLHYAPGDKDPGGSNSNSN